VFVPNKIFQACLIFASLGQSIPEWSTLLCTIGKVDPETGLMNETFLLDELLGVAKTFNGRNL
jgi:hypothetical protein